MCWGVGAGAYAEDAVSPHAVRRTSACLIIASSLADSGPSPTSDVSALMKRSAAAPPSTQPSTPVAAAVASSSVLGISNGVPAGICGCARKRRDGSLPTRRIRRTGAHDGPASEEGPLTVPRRPLVALPSPPLALPERARARLSDLARLMDAAPCSPPTAPEPDMPRVMESAWNDAPRNDLASVVSKPGISRASPAQQHKPSTRVLS